MVRNRFAAALLLLFTACSSTPQSPSTVAAKAPASTPDPTRYDQLVIVGTNDFHGYLRTVESELGGEKVLIGGAEWFAGHMRILEKKFGDRLVLLDGGDMFQGTMESNLFLGKSVVDFYNLLPYRAVAVGNHEFDYGPRKKGDPDRLGALKDRMKQARYPFVQANIYLKGTNKVWREKNLYPSVIVKAGDYKVGIVGLTTTSTPAKTLPLNVRKLEFRNLIEPTLKEAAALRAKGADLVLLTIHEGEDPARELLNAIPPGTVDALVAGHTHTEMAEFVNGTPVIESRTRGLFFGRIDLYVNKSTRRVDQTLTKIHGIHWICGTWFKNREDCDQKPVRDAVAAGKAKLEEFLPLRKVTYEGETVEADARVKAAMEPYFHETDAKKKERLGTAARDFDYYPSGESEMADLWLDAFQWKFPEARVVYLNGGGFRRRIFKGPIYYGDLFEVHPFDNFAVSVKMNGKQLKDLIRVGVSLTNAIPALAGVKVTYFGGQDKPEFHRDVNGDGKQEAWESDRLAPNGLVWEDTGKPVQDDEEFWLATNDYLVAGGDNLSHVFGAIPMNKRKYLDITQRDVAAEYLRAHPGFSLPHPRGMRIQKLD